MAPIIPCHSGKLGISSTLILDVMCLILLAVQPGDSHKLVVAANRDELYARATAQAAFWRDAPQVLGGRDLQAGGTWLGITRKGRFAAVTNFREDPPEPLPPRSRGELTANFLTSSASCVTYLKQVHKVANEYRGFNLIVFDGERCFYYSNREKHIRELVPGCYGLSNQLLNCDWPKVTRGRNQLSTTLEESFTPANLFKLLFCEGDGEPFSQSFIATERYGTSASTVVCVSTSGDVYFEERNFKPMGVQDQVHIYEFSIERQRA
ncbi:MAG: NRDE family protein [Pseudomonadales bacterium]